MNRKIKNSIIIILIINIVLLMILLAVYIWKEQNKYPEPNVTGTDFQGETKDTLQEYYPKGTYNLTREYTGTLTNKEISQRTSEFIKLVIAINNNDDTNYFIEERNNLSRFGITTQEKFDELENKIKQLGQDELKYISSKFDINSIIKDDENHLKVDLYISFENCEEIKFSERIPNDKKTSKRFIFE